MRDVVDTAADASPSLEAPGARRALRMIRLESDGEGTLQVKLYRTVRSAIARGLFPPGTRLPSSRAMAQDLGISRNTVTATLDELIADGWVEARRGSGVYVLHDRRVEPAGAGRDTPADGPDILPFDIGPPGLDFFPLDAWRRIQARRWAAMPRTDLRDGAGAGYSGLRRTIADHMWIARGVSCTPEQIVVTHSITDGLDLVLRCLTRAGDAVWVENPGFPGFRFLIEAAGRRSVPVPVDGEGLDVAAARALAPDARVAVVTPQSQFPTCVSLSEDRRAALLAWASETGAWIVEDDYDSEFRLDDDQPLPLAARPGADRVIYAYSFNKTLFPALRIGFLVLPPAVAASLIELRRHTEGYPGVPSQMVLRDFIEEGWLDTHVRACRAAYGQRRQVMYDAVEPRLARWMKFERNPFGSHLVARLKPAIDARRLEVRCRAEGLVVAAMDSFSAEPVGDQRLLLGYAGHTPRQLIDAADRLAGVLHQLSDWQGGRAA